MNGTRDRVRRAWREIEAGLAALDVAGVRLAEGASEAKLKEFEEETGVALPEEVRELFAGHDGQIGHEVGAVGFHFVSLDETRKISSDWAAVREKLGEGAKPLDRVCTSRPPKAIQRKYSAPGWVALLRDDEGNYIGVDLEPGPAGKRGQVLNFGRDEQTKYVLFPDAGELLEWLASEFRAKRFGYDEEEGVIEHEAGRLAGVLAKRVSGG